MKKILLLPTALAVTCAPLISLVACNPQQPMPPGPIDPYVTDEEMENAISFRDEEYVQALQSIDSVNCALYELSPTIYHIRDTYDSYEDEYIIRNGSFYSKIYRTSDEAE
ncbi:MAG: hypothetical protein MJ233_04720 [Mycoplasmoidaceae bacterium]|nr:hypothetical protein [Mycoplasmoidaceae bacterium]